ncbi:MAG: hypothetical protein HY925_15050 [Elusimicrobia bacterium]|nr:hypothetical protein [Elusimicrobiota bacterium]
MLAALALALASSALAGADAWSPLWEPASASRRFAITRPEEKARLASDVAARLDGLFDLLARRYSSAPAVPVNVVLVAGERGRSRTEPEKNLIRTGAEGELRSVLPSLFHELVHLFNFAQPGATQDFWSGELWAQYHAERLETLGLKHKARYGRLSRSDPKKLDWSWVSMLDENFARMPERERQQLMELGVSVYWYLEAAYGTAPTLCFQRAHLDAGRRKDPGVWEACFGVPYKKLHAGWRKYYRLD